MLLRNRKREAANRRVSDSRELRAVDGHAVFSHQPEARRRSASPCLQLVNDVEHSRASCLRCLSDRGCRELAIQRKVRAEQTDDAIDAGLAAQRLRQRCPHGTVITENVRITSMSTCSHILGLLVAGPATICHQQEAARGYDWCWDSRYCASNPFERVEVIPIRVPLARRF
jgi:hypothetical protein